MSVHCGDGRKRILENSQVRCAIVAIPVTDFVGIAAAENVETVLKVDAGGEGIGLPRQHDRQCSELAFQRTKRLMQIREKAIVLDVDLVGVHYDDSAVADGTNIP